MIVLLQQAGKKKHFWKSAILKRSNAPATINISIFAASVIIPLEKTTTHMFFSLHCVLYQEKLFNRHVHAWQGKQATVTML